MSHLIVLTVGENPLPVYVSLRHILDQIQDASFALRLLCTSQTQAIAETLKTFLQDNHPCLQQGQVALWCFPTERQPDDLCQEKLKNFLTKQQSQKPTFSFTTLHIDYTSGTQTMALGLLAWANAQNHTVIKQTYLSARDHKIYSPAQPTAQSHDLRTVYPLSIVQLCALHGQEAPPICADPSNTAALKAKLFQQFQDNEKILAAFDEFLWLTTRQTKTSPFPYRVFLARKGFELWLILDFHDKLDAKKKEIKLAAFEWLYKVKRWGGQEARLIIVIAHPTQERELYKDLTRDLDCDGSSSLESTTTSKNGALFGQVFVVNNRLNLVLKSLGAQ